MKKRIGLMGGTFDPIHKAHLALADCAKRSLGLQEVWFLPAGNPYLDKHSGVTDARIREKMAELAIDGYEGFSVNTIEMEREGNTYTVDTLRILKERFPDADFVFIIGSDQLYSLERWHQPAELFRLTEIAAAEREYPEQERAFREQAEYLAEKYHGQVRILDFPEMDISSTEIRRKIAEGQDVSSMVPEKVLRYILKEGLYREDG